MRYPTIMPFWFSAVGGVHVKEMEWEAISKIVTLPGAPLGAG